MREDGGGCWGGVGWSSARARRPGQWDAPIFGAKHLDEGTALSALLPVMEHSSINAM